MSSKKSVDETLRLYRDAALGTGSQDPKVNNRSADELHICYKQLRDSEEGRAGIVRLISDSNPHVRVWAAAHSLFWAPEIARPALEALQDSAGPASLSAKWTLREFDNGSLSFNC
jgi:hypothetical protein